MKLSAFPEGWDGLLPLLRRERPLVWGMALMTAVSSLLSCIRHWRFQTGGVDLGVFDQIVWEYSRFQAPASSLMGLSNALGDHFNPILAIISPLYWLFPGPEILFILQAFTVALGALPVFGFVQRRFGRTPAYLWTAAYATFWGLQAGLGCDFHPDLLAVPLIAFAVDFMDRQKWMGCYLCLALLLTIKEDFGLLILFFGLYLLTQRQWGRGFALMGVGLSAFCAVTLVLIPRLAGSGIYPHWVYSELGDSPSTAMGAVARDPFLVLKVMFSNAEKIQTMVCSYLASLLMIFFSPLFLLTLPGFLTRMMSSFEHHYSMGYYYSATLAPLLMMGGADGLHRLAGWFPQAPRRSRIILAVSGAVLALNLATVPVFPLRDLARWKFYRFSGPERVGSKVLALIPPEASVVAQDSIAAHLAHRARISLIAPDSCAKDCDYFVACESLPVWPMDGFQPIQQCVEQRLGQGYSKVFEGEGWVLLKSPH